jgi:hypothetical protein
VKTLIVTRHESTVPFVKEKLANTELGEVVTLSTVTASVLPDFDLVVGNLPCELAACCRRYMAVEFAEGKAPRGEDKGLDYLRQYATLCEYRVTKVV